MPGGRMPMGQPKETVRDGFKTLMRLLPYWGEHWVALTLIAVCAITSAGISVVTPLVIADTIDMCIRVKDGASLSGIVGLYGNASSLMESVSIDYTLLWQKLLLLGGIYLAGLAAGWLQDFGMTVVSQRVVGKMRSQMMNHILKLDVAYYDANSRGDLLSRFTNDVEMIRDGLGQTLIHLLTTALSMIGMIVSMCAMSGRLTALVCLSIPFVLLLTRLVIGRSRKLFSRQQNATGQLNSVIEESVAGIHTVRAMGAERLWKEKFETINSEVREVGISAQVNSGVLMPLLRLLDNLTYILVAVFGGILAIGGALTVGSIQAFLLYTRQFLRPVNMIATELNSLQSAVAGAERIFEMLDVEPKVVNKDEAIRPKDDVKGRVEFSNVSFGYKPGKMVLRGVSFTAEPGQVVAIVGGTGAGKTTMMNLLGRFYDVSDGSIMIDGIDIKDYDITYLRDSMAVVLQDPTLFTGTVAYNIAYGEPKRSDIEEIRESARQAMADTFIERLPQTYETVLTRQGESLSNGQRQLLTIARAIHSQAPMLVLDEATSNIDTHTETLLQRAMGNLTTGRTCFMIAHRLSTIRGADKIIVLEHGQIAEMGNHEELMTLGGIYKRLFESQFDEG